MAQATGSIISK